MLTACKTFQLTASLIDRSSPVLFVRPSGNNSLWETHSTVTSSNQCWMKGNIIHSNGVIMKQNLYSATVMAWNADYSCCTGRTDELDAILPPTRPVNFYLPTDDMNQNNNMSSFVRDYDVSSLLRLLWTTGLQGLFHWTNIVEPDDKRQITPQSACHTGIQNPSVFLVS
jgi:hypothetical protein